MARPTIESVAPNEGSTRGGDLVQLVGEGIAARVRVRFGELAAEVLAVRPAGAQTVIDVRTPSHPEEHVAVLVENLDPDGEPITGEGARLEAAYRFARPRLAEESDLARVVRTLLQLLKRDVLDNTTMRVSVDYADERHVDGMRVVPIAALPALVLTPVQMPENRMYSTNELREQVVAGPDGPEIVRHAPPLTVDLELQLTGSSDSTLELLNLIAAVGRFLNRTKWIEMLRDPGWAHLGAVRWELHAGPLRTRLDGPDGLGAFTVDLVVRGFDLDEGGPMDRAAPVREQTLVVGAKPSHDTP